MIEFLNQNALHTISIVLTFLLLLILIIMISFAPNIFDFSIKNNWTVSQIPTFFSFVNYRSLILFVVFLYTTGNIEARENILKLSFGQKIQDNMLVETGLDEAKWEIRKKKKVLAEGIGNTLFEYSFKKPGNYKLYFSRHVTQPKVNYFGKKFTELHVCDHFCLPDFLDINVSSQKIEYLCDRITFSAPLKGGINIDDLVLYVPVVLSNFRGNKALRLSEKVSAFGVNAELVGYLVSDFLQLRKGNHVLEFKLNGKVASDTYIGFDFMDLNGHTVPCSIPHKI